MSEAVKPSAKRKRVEEKEGSMVLLSIKKMPKKPTVVDRVMFALTALNIPSSAQAIIKTCTTLSEIQYSDAKKIRKAIQDGLSSGKLVLSPESKQKFWLAEVPFPEVEKCPEITILKDTEGSGDEPAIEKGHTAGTLLSACDMCMCMCLSLSRPLHVDVFLSLSHTRTKLNSNPNSDPNPTGIYYSLALASAKTKVVERSGKQIFTFLVGDGDVIKGMDAGVLGMKLHGKRDVLIPWQLGYGKRGSGKDIPPESDLIFKIEMVELSQ